MSYLSRAVAALALVAMLGNSGCIGSFAATQKVLDWNRGLGSLVVQELVFIGLNIIPVYGVVVFADAVVLNIIEAATGDNPLARAEALDESHVVDLGDQGTLYLIPRNGRVALQHVLPDGTRGKEMWARRKGVEMELFDDQDQLVATARPGAANDTLELVSPQGEVLFTLPMG